MITSLLLGGNINVFVEKIKSDNSLQTGLVVLYEVGNVVKVFDIVLSVSLRAVFLLLDKIFEVAAFFSLDLSLVKELFHLERF